VTSEPGLPGWLQPVADAALGVLPEQLSGFRPPATGGRAGAVLILFGMGETGPDVLLIERAHDMRSHAGQMAFPGGAVDPEDADEVAAALREAVEETGLDPRGVQVFASLPALFLPPSGFVVTPVLGWWHTPSAVHAVDPREVASVHRVPVADLVAPVNRLRVRHPSGWVGAAFRLGDLLVWGFTAGLLDRLLRLAGWEEPWGDADPEELPPDLAAMSMRTEVSG
jgi:8-oxo-dGTP pyrophosphatase MutT (NUDIX family)